MKKLWERREHKFREGEMSEREERREWENNKRKTTNVTKRGERENRKRLRHKTRGRIVIVWRKSLWNGEKKERRGRKRGRELSNFNRKY